MKWIVGALVVVIGLGLIIAGGNDSASSLFGAITGTSPGPNATSGASSSSPSSSSSGSSSSPSSSSNLLPNNPAYPGLSSVPAQGAA